MMKKINILIWLILLSVFQIKASGDSYELVVWTHLGDRIGYSLDEQPRVTLELESLIVSTIKTKVEYSLDDVRKFTLNKNDVTGIDEVKQLMPTMKFNSNTLTFTGCIPGSKIKIMSVNGINLYTLQADNNGYIQIDISALSSGMYLVVTSSITYKIIK
jgi:hypothetical protein